MRLRTSLAVGFAGLLLVAFSLGFFSDPSAAAQDTDGLLLGKRPPAPTPTSIPAPAPVSAPAPGVGVVDARPSPLPPARRLPPEVLPAVEEEPSPVANPAPAAPRGPSTRPAKTLPKTGTGIDGLLGVAGLALVVGSFAIEASHSGRPVEA